MDKATLRKYFIQARLDMNEELHALHSSFIIQKLKEHPLYQQAKSIGIYISFHGEVDTLSSLESMIKDKEVYVPCVDGRTMNFVRLTSLHQLKRGSFGILEPQPPYTILNQLDLLIVPLVAYNQDCYRLGYGGGYYDRFLSLYPTPTIGLAFSFQYTKQSYQESHDIPLDIIITEK